MRILRKLEDLQFDNTYARLPAAFYAELAPTPFPEPYLVSFNPAAAELIDLDPDEVKRPEFVEYFSGSRLLPGSQPIAMLYSGHQFGVYVPQLGAICSDCGQASVYMAEGCMTCQECGWSQC